VVAVTPLALATPTAAPVAVPVDMAVFGAWVRAQPWSRPDECGPAGWVYLLCFVDPATGAKAWFHHAGHYLGWTPNLPSRIAKHAAGRGARLVEVIIGAGLGFELARVWPGTLGLERQLKRRHGGPRLCPLCRRTGLPLDPAVVMAAALAMTGAPGRPPSCLGVGVVR